MELTHPIQAEEALDLITEAIEQAGYTGKVKIAMDVASSEFYKADAKKYDLDYKNPNSDKSKWITYEQLADQYKHLASKYPIVSLEDPFAEDDWEVRFIELGFHFTSSKTPAGLVVFF